MVKKKTYRNVADKLDDDVKGTADEGVEVGAANDAGDAGEALLVDQVDVQGALSVWVRKQIPRVWARLYLSLRC